MWRWRHEAASKKTRSWYTTIAILAVGGAVASIIAGNVLFGFLIIIGSFTIMLAGSRPESDKAYALSDVGIHIDERVIPWSSVERFCINEVEHPHRLIVDTKTMMGTVGIPLVDIDFRAVRTEFRNNNIEEVEEIDSLIEWITEKIGL